MANQHKSANMSFPIFRRVQVLIHQCIFESNTNQRSSTTTRSCRRISTSVAFVRFTTTFWKAATVSSPDITSSPRGVDTWQWEGTNGRGQNSPYIDLLIRTTVCCETMSLVGNMGRVSTLPISCFKAMEPLST